MPSCLKTRVTRRDATSRADALLHAGRRPIIALALSASFLAAVPVLAATPQKGADDELQDIIVTANKREENLQKVPISITVLDAETIERAGVKKVADFVNLTPNAQIRGSFRVGEVFISIRGITTTSGGFSPATFTIDGVQKVTLDQINTGVLSDIERIEVLKGPQGVLYGAGAIAGAVNIITKKPTNTFEGGITTSYGNGDDFRASAAISGPIVEDKVFFRISGYHRNFDGLIIATDGSGVDADRMDQLNARLLFDLGKVKIDLTGSYADAKSGAVPLGIVANLADKNVYNDQTKPKRGIDGLENRKYKSVSARVDWDLGTATLTSISGYDKIKSSLFGTFSYTQPPILSLIGLVGMPGSLYSDAYQQNARDFSGFTQDTRLTSNGNGRFRWLVGASYYKRKLTFFSTVGGVSTATGALVPSGPRTDVLNDEAWGVYAQGDYDLTDKLTLTAGTRFDKDRFDDTRYTNLTLQTVVPNTDGSLIQKTVNDKWQPKVTATYHWTDDILTYATFSVGYRFGFYNAGSFASPESLNNYEVGFKTDLLDHKLRINGALFHMQYANRQVVRTILVPPFRTTTNTPSSNIDGGELTVSALLGAGFEVSAGGGYVDTSGPQISGVSKYSVNATINHSIDLAPAWELVSRADYRRTGAFLGGSAAVPIMLDPATEVNASTSLKHGPWTAGLFVKNLLDQRRAFVFAALPQGYLRNINPPRSYYMELSYRF